MRLGRLTEDETEQKSGTEASRQTCSQRLAGYTERTNKNRGRGGGEAREKRQEKRGRARPRKREIERERERRRRREGEREREGCALYLGHRPLCKQKGKEGGGNKGGNT